MSLAGGNAAAAFSVGPSLLLRRRRRRRRRRLRLRIYGQDFFLTCHA